MLKKKALVFLVSLLAVPAFASAPLATHMFGPNAPAFADTNGDGMVTVADTPIVATRTGPTTVTLAHPWQAGINNLNTFTLSNPDGSGRYQSVSRTYGEGTQTVTVTGLKNNAPSAFSFTEVGAHGTFTGTITLIDQNHDGIWDGFTATGRNGQINFSLNFVDIDSNGDGYADFISIPWAAAGAAGVNFKNKVGGTTPQVFFPLADTNGDGKGDSIMFDLDGDNVADPDIMQMPPGSFGPVVAAASVAPVPTMSEWFMLLTVLFLGGLGMWQLRALQTRQAAVRI